MLKIMKFSHMRTDIFLPREDVNDDTALITEWLVSDGAEVLKDQLICRLETTKTIFEITAPAAGFLHIVAEAGTEAEVGALIAYISDNCAKETGEPSCASPENASGSHEPPNTAVKATKKAEAYAAQHGIDLSAINKNGIITLADVEAFASEKSAAALPSYCRLPDRVKRVLVLGAGVAAMQVLDILLHDREVLPVGCLDDNPAVQGATLFGVPVLGTLDRLEDLWKEHAFDACIVGVGTNLAVRAKFFAAAKNLGIPMVNAIDPTARINRHAVLGEGIVMCSFVHVGLNALIGDNCFLAAHTNVDHHCHLGNTVLMGPGCLLSGTVSVGSQVLMGSGVIIQPCLKIGDNCRIASGSVIIKDIPSDHAVKMHAVQDIVPIK